MKSRYEIFLIVGIIAVGSISTLAYLTQSDFFTSPKRSGNQWSNTQECPENFIIYKNNCDATQLNN